MVGSLASTRFAGRTHIFSYEAWRGVAEMKTRVLLASKAWGVSFALSAATRFAAKTYVFGYEAEGSRCVEENASVAGFEGLGGSLSRISLDALRGGRLTSSATRRYWADEGRTQMIG